MHKFGGPFVFISTHAPLARRDCRHIRIHLHSLYFYSRASCEARHTALISMIIAGNAISTHAPLARRDIGFALKCVLFQKFLLTRLLRGATYPHESTPAIISDFYSRASCEARLNFSWIVFLLKLFLLTRLLRGATLSSSASRYASNISTHAPLARRDHAS